jgi:cytochrome c oxidase subunit 2
MHSLRSILLLFLIGFSGNALAQVALERPNETVTGEELFVTCVFCHGDSAQGNDRRDGPAIAGLPVWYLELQMHNFVNGIRGYLPEDAPGQVMHFTKGMLRNDFTISSVAEYVSALEPGKPMAGNAVGARPYIWDSPYAGLDPSITGDAAAGGQTYTTVCTVCHGADGTGNEALGAADLRYLSEIYVARQLMYFRDGIRGAHPEDTGGQQMAVMAKLLTTDQAVADMVAYISGL